MRLAIVLLALALAGCSTTGEVRTVTKVVNVPVPCDPPIPARPSWAVDALPLTAEVDEQMRALRADRVRGNAYIDQLESALQSCRDVLR